MDQLRTTTSTSNSNDGDETTPPKVRRRSRPISRPEEIFNFDKHIPIEDIHFANKMLGRGQFGQVELAYVTINGVKKECAVKMIRGTLFNFTVFASVIKNPIANPKILEILIIAKIEICKNFHRKF